MTSIFTGVILYYLARICKQKNWSFKYFYKFFTKTFNVLAVVCFFLGCSSDVKHKLDSVSGVPNWFKNSKRFAKADQNGNYLTHPFFDLVPFSSMEDNSINFVMTGHIDSKAYYRLNLPSGDIYRENLYCLKKSFIDRVSNLSFRGSVDRPNFTFGYVPRLLDQLGRPQRVIVFGNNKYYTSLKENTPVSHRVRVVGGVLDSFCPKYSCMGNEWLSRLLLIAVDTNDTKFKDTHDFISLKKKIDWNKSVSFLEGQRGMTHEGEKYSPAYQVSGNVDASEALMFAVRKGHLFKFKELQVLQKNCHRLYDHIWKSVTNLRGNGGYNVFSKYFASFYQKFGRRYKACSNLVKNYSLNDDIDRFWFFQYLSGIFKMNSINKVFLCPQARWVDNWANTVTKKKHGQIKEFKECSSRNLDKAFKQMQVILSARQESGTNYFRFLEYDNGIAGSHKKIYSWVEYSGKSRMCNDDYIDNRGSLTLPKDISWNKLIRRILTKKK